MLRNRTYLGEIAHKDKSYRGQHELIISADLWSKVQAVFATNPAARGQDTKIDLQGKPPALLRGLLLGEFGERMLPTYTNKKGVRRYTYYIFSIENKYGVGASHMPRLPAGEIDKLVLDQVRATLDAREIAVTFAASATYRRRTNSAGVSIGYLSRSASRSPSPVTSTSALTAVNVARIGASSGSRGTSTDIGPSSTTSARM